MLKVIVLFAGGLLLNTIASTAYSSPILNMDNGHYYEVFWKPNGYTWDEAKEEAGSRTFKGFQGHLATITSESENNWITDNLEGYEGAFIGASDAASEGDWQWVTGETFSFSAWEDGEPNAWNALNEDYLMFWWENADDNFAAAGWNDTVNDPYAEIDFELGYIVEYDNVVPDSASVPVPAAIWFFGAGLLGLTGYGRRKIR